MKQELLKETLELHKEWIDSNEVNGKRVNFFYSNLEKADLSFSNLNSINFSHSNLKKADLRYSDLIKSEFRGANLQGANLQGANLQGADLFGANLAEANLQGANLQGANLAEANLQGADLYGTNLRGVNLDKTKGIIYISSGLSFQTYGYMYNKELRVRLGDYNRTVEEWDSYYLNVKKEGKEEEEQFLIFNLIKNWVKFKKNEN